MAKTPAERGPIGTWLLEQRQQRGWKTAVVARRELLRLGGIRIAPSVYAEWESGRRLPSDANLARLEAFYGSAPQQTATPPGGDVAAAIDRQTQAIRDQTAMLAQLLERLTPQQSFAPDEMEYLRGLAQNGTRIPAARQETSTGSR